MTKKPEPSGKEVIDQAKTQVKQTKKEQKETNMKNFTQRMKTPLTILATLAVVAVLYAFYSWSFEQGVSHEKSISVIVQNEVAAQLKHNQK